MKINNKLREIRLKEYLMDSKTEFSIFLDIPIQTYSKWEKSISTPSLVRALEIASKLNRNVNEIWYIEE